MQQAKYMVVKDSQTFYTDDYDKAYWYALSVKASVQLNPDFRR